MKIKAGHLKHYFEGQDVEIDQSIYKLIILFNELGYETYSCCSGLKRDHPGPNDATCGFYIAFSVVIPDKYIKVAGDLGFKCDEWIKSTWIGAHDNGEKLPVGENEIESLISKWEEMLMDEIRNDLIKMKDATKGAFQTGYRK